MNKRKKVKTFGMLVGVVLTIFWGMYHSNISERPKQTKDFYSLTNIEKNQFRKGLVVKVVDGDTLDLQLENGIERVRLIGVNTPETKHPKKPVEVYGREASSYTAKSLLHKNVYLETDVGIHDRYGRRLGYIWLLAPKAINESEIRTKLFNAMLLEYGYAQVMTVPPNVKYVDYFRKLQKEARTSQKGLWAFNHSSETRYMPK